MQIDMLNAPTCGNAVKLVLSPTGPELRWRVLRNETGVFYGHDDPAAFLVHEGSDRHLTDARFLVNGVTYHYCAFGEVSPGVWVASPVQQATPELDFEDQSPDPQEIVRERLELTLNAMIQKGRLRLTVPSIPVLSIPFYNQDVPLPVVTVLYGGGSSAAHGLGELVGTEEALESYVGFMQAVTLDVSVWSLNADERNALRRGLLAAVAANLDIFSDAGLNMPEVQSVSDTEDFQSMNAPMYQTQMRLGCQVSTSVSDGFGVFANVIVMGN